MELSNTIQSNPLIDLALSRQKHVPESIRAASPLERRIRSILSVIADSPYKLLAALDPAGSIMSSSSSVCRKLEEGDLIGAVSIYRRNQKEFAANPDFARSIAKYLQKLTVENEYKEFNRVASLFRLSRNAKIDALIELIEDGNLMNFGKIQNALGIADVTLACAIPNASIKALGNLNLSKMHALQNGAKTLGIRTVASSPIEIIPGLVKAALRSGQSCKTYAHAAGVDEKFLGEAKLSPLPLWQTQLAKNFSLKTYDDIDQFIVEQTEYAEFIGSKQCTPRLLRSMLPVLKVLRISAIEGEELLQAGYDLRELVGNQNKLVQALGESSSVWADVQHVKNPFNLGVQYFGIDKMLHFSYKPGVRRHDTLFEFQRVVDVMNSSGVASEQFYEQILKQVHRDDGAYPDGSSFHMLNSIVEKLDLNFEKVLEDGKNSDFVPEIKALIDSFTDKASIFKSWRNFKKYSELAALIKNRELLIELEALRRSGKEELYNFISSLAFRPDSQIRIDKLFSFWKEPENFLASGRTSLSPINYCEMPHVDLPPDVLRDALVCEKLDKIQALPSSQTRYVVPRTYAGFSTVEMLTAALGSKSKGIPGVAVNTRKLFSEVNKVLTDEGMTVTSYLEQRQASPSAERKIFDLIFHKDFGVRDEFVEVIVKVNAKSDPDGLIAGNDTASCMPFGSEKNNVYMYNPNCALLTVQLVLDGGKLKTIAQSVLTLDGLYNVDPQIAAQKLMSEKSRDWDPIQGVMFRQKPQPLITCDNIEIAPNFRDAKNAGVIGACYREFLTQYVDILKETDIDQKRAVVGLGYTEALKNFPRIANRFLPLSPVSYSDNLKPQAIEIQFAGSRSLVKAVGIHSLVPNGFINKVENEDGVVPLTYLDTLSVTSIEHGRYKGGLGESFSEIANTLVGKEISNSVHGRPELSFIKYNKDHIAEGYIIAYEGRFDPSGIKKKSKLPIMKGEEIIYISDFATLEDKGGEAVELIAKFMQAYKDHYISANRFPPIVAEFRQETSYALLPVLLRRYQKMFGMEFDVTALKPYTEDKSTMYPLIIKPRQV